MSVAESVITPKEGDQSTHKVSQSYWSLVWWKFKRNRMAILGGVIFSLCFWHC